MTGAIGRVADQVGRPGQPNARVLGTSDQDEMRFVLRLPRKEPLRPANDRWGNPAVSALIDAALTLVSPRRVSGLAKMTVKRKRKI